MIKATDPEATIAVVWHRDPAIDQEASKIADDYLGTCAKDAPAARAVLKFRGGARPTEWILGVVPPARMNEADDMEGRNARSWHCFLHSVRAIKEPGELTAGIKDRKPPIVTVNGVEYVDPEWLAAKMIGPLRRCALDLGVVVWLWNSLQEDDAKNLSAPSSHGTSTDSLAQNAPST